MTDDDLSGLDRDPPDEYSPRLNIDQPFSLPENLSDGVNAMIEAEQWLLELGVREMVTGIGSADEASFMNGVRKLKAILETQFTAGVARGRHDVLEHVTPQRMVFLSGFAVGGSTAFAVLLISRWALGI